MATQGEDRLLRLADGRTLGYAEYGAARGDPVFVFHGTPGSRLMARAAHAAAAERGIRIVAPDRPGFGLSTRQRERRITDWPGDVAQLADALDIPRFAVVGISGGGPYAVACAWALPERVVIAGIVSGVAPPEGPDLGGGLRRPGRALFNLLLVAPSLTRAGMTLIATAWRGAPQWTFERIRKVAPLVERSILERPEVATSLLAGLSEAFRSGGQGAADELMLFLRPWDLPLDQIRVPVRLWHGELDGVVPAAMGRYLAHAIPTCEAEFTAGAGHYMVYDRIDQLLAALS